MGRGGDPPAEGEVEPDVTLCTTLSPLHSRWEVAKADEGSVHCPLTLAERLGRRQGESRRNGVCGGAPGSGSRRRLRQRETAGGAPGMLGDPLAALPGLGDSLCSPPPHGLSWPHF